MDTDDPGDQGRRFTPEAVDQAVAVVLVVVVAAIAVVTDRSDWAKAIGAVLSVGLAALVARRRHPLAVVAVLGATVVGEAALGQARAKTPLLVIAVMVAAYSLGAYTKSWRAGLPGLALAVATIGGAQALAPRSGYSAASSLVFFGAVAGLLPYGVGRIARSRRRLAQQLRETSEQLEATGDDHVATRVAAQRTQLGRSVDARVLIALDEMSAHAAVACLDDIVVVEQIARRTLGDVRALLVGLRGEPESTGPPTPLTELHAQVRAALTAGVAAPEIANTCPGRWSLLSDRWISRALIVAAAIYGAGVVATTIAHTRPIAVGVDAVVALAMGLAVAGLRRWPVPAAFLCCVAAAAYAATAQPRDPLSGVAPAGILALAPVALGAWATSGRGRWAGLLACLISLPISVVVDPRAHLHPGSASAAPALVIGLFGMGAVLQSRSRAVADLAAKVLRVDQGRAAKAKSALRAERERIARELHDAMAHSLTAILMQATAARRVWQSNPHLAHEHADRLRESMAATVGDLRHLAISLTMGSPMEVGLDQVRLLVERARASGVQVELCMNGSLPERRPEIDLAGYRILQEALTNAARHAPGSRVKVQIRQEEYHIALLVENSAGSSHPWPTISGRGQGLDGMRERVQSCGGQLIAHPDSDGGFSVHARLPLAAVR